MTTIELRFLANRYHATAWGRHVNEGVPEWPPSPYRLIRALFDAWKRKYAHIEQKRVEPLFAALASKLPVFHLEQAVSAHTRSYLSSNTTDRSDKSLIFDAFVSLPPESACSVQWEFDLAVDERAVLAELLEGLNYLGRSESWVAASLGETHGQRFQCLPASHVRKKDEIVYLACPVPAPEYTGKRKWMDALTYSTSELTKEKLSGPPAMRPVPYSLPRGAVKTWVPPARGRRQRLISGVVLELDAKVLPRITEAIWVAERLRGRLMRYFENRGLEIPPVIHGKDSDGRPLLDHSHLYILPRPNQRGQVKTITVFKDDGHPLDRQVVTAITSVAGLAWMDEIRLTPVWVGPAEDYSFRPQVQTAVSITPFVTVRHWRKGRGQPEQFIAEEIARECENHNLPRPRVIQRQTNAAGIDPLRFRRNRKDDPSRPGYAFKLVFDEPVAAPFSLGYACHFGLGQFAPE